MGVASYASCREGCVDGSSRGSDEVRLLVSCLLERLFTTEHDLKANCDV